MQATQQQSGAGQQRDGKCHLDDDQRSGQTSATSSAASAFRFEHWSNAGFSGIKCRHNTEKQYRETRDCDQETHDGEIRTNVQLAILRG